MTAPRLGRSDRGSVVVLVVLFLPVFLLTLGFVIDLGVLFVQRQQAMAAADMAVLAGAREIDLDKLARGERSLLPEAAAAVTRQWFASNLRASLGSEAESASAVVHVYNATPANPATDPVTGRRLRDPTVCLAGQVSARLYFLAFIARETTLHVHADASLLLRH
ncbi:MAG: pilus assembly protein TadG-related protein [Bacillota bacterium]